MKLVKRPLHYISKLEHVLGKRYDAADALCRMGLSTAEAWRIPGHFFNTRSIAMLRTDILDRMGPIRNIPFDLQIIAEDAKNSQKNKELLDAVKEGKELKSLASGHTAMEFSEG